MSTKPALLITISVGAILIALSLLIRFQPVDKDHARVKSTEQSTNIIDPIRRELKEYYDLGFSSGVFWGARAVLDGATNMADVELRAYRLKREAGIMTTRHKQELEKAAGDLY